MGVSQLSWGDHEFSGSIRFCICGGHSGSGRFLPVEAKASGEARFEHHSVAAIFIGDPGQRAVPKAEEELAIDPATLIAGAGSARINTPVFCDESATGR